VSPNEPTREATGIGQMRRVALASFTLVVSALLVVSGSAVLAGIWLVIGRLLYVLYVGLSLAAEDRSRALSRRHGAEGAYARFRDISGWTMLTDSLAITVLCIVTRGTLPEVAPRWAVVTAGVALVAIGMGIKWWAAASLEPGSYFWRNFFVPPVNPSKSARGPYRWVSNPMYTIGYAHAYGFALLMQSGPGLVAAAFAQGAVLVMHMMVERPHFRRLREQ
jgi:protein-S-isoprenylcysteine O-methyltransferase Ste14